MLAIRGILDGNIADWSIENMSYTSGDFFSISSETAAGAGVGLSQDKNTMYVVDRAIDVIFQYALGTTGIVKSASYTGKSFAVGSQDANPQDLFLRPGEERAYILGDNNDKIFQYDLSVAGDINSSVYNGKSLGLSGGLVASLWIKPTGTILVHAVTGTAKVFQNTLSTPWAVDTGGSTDGEFDFSAQGSEMRGSYFDPTMRKMFLMSVTDVYQYTLSTPGTLSSAAYDSVSFDLTNETSFNQGMWMDQETLITVNGTDDRVYQYFL